MRCSRRCSRAAARFAACLALLGALAVGGLAVGPARAQEEHGGPGEYALTNQNWNGLSAWAVLAQGAGFQLQPTDRFDWAELRDDDVLVILYPQVPLDPSHLTTFLRRGGRLLLGDDFGEAREALAKLSMLRRPANGVHATRWQDDNPALPVAQPWLPTHPLALGVDALRTNHPAVFHTSPGPDAVFGFGAGEAVVVAGALGEGRFVALADPSVLLNGMLAFDGNLTFASNLLAWLAPPADSGRDGPPPRLVVLTGSFLLGGAPPEVLDDAPADSANSVLADFGRFLDELNDYLASEAALRALAVAGAALLLGLALLVLKPFAAAPRTDGAFTRARVADDRGDYEERVARFDRGQEASYAWPAALLRDAVDERLAELAGVADPLSALAPAALLKAVETRAGREAAVATQALLPGVAALPSRSLAQLPWAARHVSRREFSEVHERAETFFRVLSQGGQEARG